MRSSSNRWGAVLLAAALVTAPAMAQDKDSFTPMPMDSGFCRIDLTPPTTPPEEIIKKFAAKESEFQDALNHYTYRRVARVQTLDDDSKVRVRDTLRHVLDEADAAEQRHHTDVCKRCIFLREDRTSAESRSTVEFTCRLFRASIALPPGLFWMTLKPPARGARR